MNFKFVYQILETEAKKSKNESRISITTKIAMPFANACDNQKTCKLSYFKSSYFIIKKHQMYTQKSICVLICRITPVRLGVYPLKIIQQYAPIMCSQAKMMC